MNNLLKKLALAVPPIRNLVSERDELSRQTGELLLRAEQLERQCQRLESEHRLASEKLAELKRLQGFAPPGHFYSPIPDFNAAADHVERIFERPDPELGGIELRERAQLELLESFVPFYREMEFTAKKRPGVRYYYENPAYSYSDAILLHCMIRKLCPSRIVEIGSGFSSCMIIDTNELYFNDQIDLTFIEPHPELLISLLEDTDLQHIRIHSQPLQEASLDSFRALEAGDILFIDSTHVSKTGSDVNRIFFEILPSLAEGVYVHFHDIFFPFEYPQEWLREGRAWNESYLLKAFLQFNRDFRIVLMNTYMHRYHREFFESNMPLTLKNTGGSIWLERTTGAAAHE